VGKSIAYNFKLRMTEKSSQMNGWIIITIITPPARSKGKGKGKRGFV